jgi:hypothetical protein
MNELKVNIVEFVDSRFPGWVVAEFVDAEGRTHRIIDKWPIFTEKMLDADSAYPQGGSTECVVIERWSDERGREVVKIRCLESTEGKEEYVVLASQVTGVL